MDELSRLEHWLRFPSVDIQIDALRKLRHSIEAQLDTARSTQLAELRARHAEDQPHPDDASLDNYEAETFHTHYLPKVFRGGFLLMLWAAMETDIKSIAHHAASKAGKPLGRGYFSADLLGQAERALSSSVGVALFGDGVTREALLRFRDVRNALVHYNGDIVELRGGLQALSESGLQALGLNIEADLHHKYVVPTDEFVEQQVQLVENFLRRLQDVVFAALHLDQRSN